MGLFSFCLFLIEKKTERGALTIRSTGARGWRRRRRLRPVPRQGALQTEHWRSGEQGFAADLALSDVLCYFAESTFQKKRTEGRGRGPWRCRRLGGCLPGPLRQQTAHKPLSRVVCYRGLSSVDGWFRSHSAWERGLLWGYWSARCSFRNCSAVVASWRTFSPFLILSISALSRVRARPLWQLVKNHSASLTNLMEAVVFPAVQLFGEALSVNFPSFFFFLTY